MSSKKPIFKESFRNYFGSILKDELDKFIEYSEMPLKESIRVNTLKITKEELKKLLLEKGWEVEDIPFYKDGLIIKSRNESLGNTIEHFLGYYYVQEQSSMIPPLVLEPKEGEIVLDCCASPGSKTGQISQMMKNKGVIVANDKDLYRISMLQSNLQRMGAKNVIITRGKAQRFGKLDEFFDKILVDAPCSGMGAIRKDWSIAKMFNEKAFRFLSRIQKEIIGSVWNSLKRGGTLVYSTCTLTLEENEEIIRWLLDKKEDAVLENIKLAGFEKDRGIELPETIRIWPHRKDMEGFFIAKVRKE